MGRVLGVLLALLFCGYALAQGGRVDLKFPLLLADDANVTAIETQTDGKILIAGKFTTTGAVLRKDIVRLNTDGTMDTTFDAGTGSDNIGLILAIKLQTDGKIMVAGTFNTFNGEFRHSVVRLNTDGSVDGSFALSGLDVTFAFDLDIQPDGKILITASNLIGLSFVARFNTNGSNDGGIGQNFFTMSGGGYGYKLSYMASESKILVSARAGSPSNQANVAKVNISGGMDQTFSVIATGDPSDLQVFARSFVSGKILVWGKFTSVNQVARKNIAIVNTDGSLDPSFVAVMNGAETILATAVQPDGKIIIAGSGFASNNAVSGNIARLNADGSVDTTFKPGRGSNNAVKALKILSTNKLMIGGSFFRYAGFPRAGIAQLKL